ncbi:MAG TPA: hypothetical protein VFE25_09965 [Opitutaceae bacterium]|nr:hypothetical protein [Opitutaceae bacterium]
MGEFGFPRAHGDGARFAGFCVDALAYAGEKDRAIAEVERLLMVPWGLNVYQVSAELRPLHDMPKFKQLLDDPKNNAPLY